MTLSQTDCGYIVLNDSTVVDGYVADPADFSKISVQLYYNCESVYSIDFEDDPVDIPVCGDTDRVRICSDLLRIYPDGDTFSDGIYGVIIKGYYDDDTIVTEKACIFMDCSTKCTVPEDNLLAMMYHYVLTNTYDCDCDCAKLCEIYSNFTTEIEKEADGCSTCM